ncbi:NAC domain containing protein 71 [Actinidia rufa]|uniref:NAC domain containing protein 71 n=1 Tax=Actinidia rufa TaxID=165716 RepID=A0A7J0H1H8_9ERIC|nr:NAC domain containing protein 71 [Actinidia rufa]
MVGATLPPGFRFHPTDEELVGYYLKGKFEGLVMKLEVIPVIDCINLIHGRCQINRSSQSVIWSGFSSVTGIGSTQMDHERIMPPELATGKPPIHALAFIEHEFSIGRHGMIEFILLMISGGWHRKMN